MPKAEGKCLECHGPDCDKKFYWKDGWSIKVTIHRKDTNSDYTVYFCGPNCFIAHTLLTTMKTNAKLDGMKKAEMINIIKDIPKA